MYKHPHPLFTLLLVFNFQSQMVKSNQFPFIFLKWVHPFLLPLVLHHGTTADAQSTMEPVPTFATHHNWDPSVAVMVGALVCAFLFMGILSIYVRHCAESYIAGHNGGGAGDWPCSCSKGIDRELLATFPILFYSTIKDLKIGKATLECAVCLRDFKDYDTLRLLPKCNHVFHPDCIDAWLASHVTCPVCRAKLNQELGEIAIAVPTQLNADEVVDESSEPVGDENGETEQDQVVSNACEGRRNDEEGEGKRNAATKSNLFGKLTRSNSTGHSLVEPRKCVERYTLRLPEDVRRYILLNQGTIQRSASYNNVGSSRKGMCWSDSEGSSGGKKNNGEVKQERWVLWTQPFVARHG